MCVHVVTFSQPLLSATNGGWRAAPVFMALKLVLQRHESLRALNRHEVFPVDSST